MKRFFLCVIFSLILIGAWELSFSQSNREADGRAMEQSGRPREALTNYIAALQAASEGSADDQRLRETIIKLVLRIQPPPAIPEEARRFAIRGRTWIKDGKSQSDFEEAAKEFANALRVAPWWADGYFNHAVALEQSGKFSEAIRSLRLYVLAAPAGPDLDKVKDRIYALEVRQERAGREAGVRKEQQQSQDFVRSLAGTWELRISNRGGASRYAATVQGNSLEMTITEILGSSERWQVPSPQTSVYRFRGTVNALSVTGTVTIDYSGELEGAGVFSSPFSGTISPDGRSIQIGFTIAEPCCGWRWGGPGTRTGDRGRGGGFRNQAFSAEFKRQ